jgi:hypothetical protein
MIFRKTYEEFFFARIFYMGLDRALIPLIKVPRYFSVEVATGYPHQISQGKNDEA